MIKKIIFIVLAISIFLLAACTAPQEAAVGASQTPFEPVHQLNIAQLLKHSSAFPFPRAFAKRSRSLDPQAKYIFFLIGDGMGDAHKQLSEELS